MYGIVPTMSPDCVIDSPSVLASPKSVTQIRPAASSRRLDG
jgi:hypothetical protein